MSGAAMLCWISKFFHCVIWRAGKDSNLPILSNGQPVQILLLLHVSDNYLKGYWLVFHHISFIAALITMTLYSYILPSYTT
jgi:hypothetical protein